MIIVSFLLCILYIHKTLFDNSVSQQTERSSIAYRVSDHLRMMMKTPNESRDSTVYR